MERRSYQTPPSLSGSRIILLERFMKPLTVKFVSTENFKPFFPATCPLAVCSLYSPHHIFLKVFSCRGLLDRYSVIHNLEFPLSKPGKLGPPDCGKLYILTMRNNVAHLTVIKTEAARFCKKVSSLVCINLVTWI